MRPTSTLALPKTAVLGAGGFFGRRLLAAHRAAHPDCVATYHTSGQPVLDIFRPDIAPLRLPATGHRDVVIAAAVVDVQKCEWQPELTYPGNVTGTLELIRQISEAGLKPIYISTDWVFRGDTGDYRDDAKQDPVCGYGAQKAAVEQGIQALCGDNFLVVRLSKLFSLDRGDHSTPDQIAASLAQGRKVRAAWDQIYGPLLVEDAVGALLGLQAADAKGFVNICSPEIWSRFGVAEAIADALGADRALVASISLDELEDKIQRPKRTNMICERLKQLAPFEFVPMAHCIARVAANYR
jgi:dTDP-4-dehydrorhamnose reductase